MINSFRRGLLVGINVYGYYRESSRNTIHDTYRGYIHHKCRGDCRDKLRVSSRGTRHGTRPTLTASLDATFGVGFVADLGTAYVPRHPAA